MRSATKRICVFGVVLVSLLTIGLDSTVATAADEAADAEKYNLPTVGLRVQDADGRPIQKFEYTHKGGRVTQIDPGPDGNLPKIQLVSNPNGTTRIVNYNTGSEWTLFVGAPGYVTKPTQIPLEPPAEIVVTLERGARVAGKVVNSSKLPVAGAIIWLGAVPLSGHHGRPAHIMETDALGNISSNRIPIGKVGFGIYHPDYIAEVHERVVSAGNANGVLFTLDSGASLTGTIRFGSEPAESADIYVAASVANDSRRVSGLQGKFAVRGLLPGPAHCVFRAFQPHPGFHATQWMFSEMIDFVANESKRVEKSFPIGSCALTGHIFIHGGPQTNQHGVSIHLTHGETGSGHSLQVSSSTNAEGYYAIDCLPAGSWKVHADMYDEERKEWLNFRKDIVMPEGESLQLDISFPEDATK